MRKYFIAGLLFWIPIWATFVVIRFLVNVFDQTLALVPSKYQPDKWLGFHIPGLGLLFSILLVFLTGLLVANFIGSRMVSGWEKLLSRIPLIRSIHAAVKQLLSAFIHPTSTSFRKVLLIEFPRTGMWSIGFQTSAPLANLPHQKTSIMAFIPTTPNPTSGFLVVVPQDEVTELDMTVEEAFKIIISIGVTIPARDLNKFKTSIGHS